MRASRPAVVLFSLLMITATATAGESFARYTRQIQRDDLTLLTDFIVTLDSSSPGTTPLITVTGSVTLGGGFVLNATGAPFPTGHTYLLIENDGTDAIIGTFNGLPEGAIITSGGQMFSISYTGGSGNDLVLTAIAPGGAVPALDSIALAAMTILLAGAALFVMKR